MIKVRVYEKGDAYKLDALPIFQPLPFIQSCVDAQGTSDSSRAYTFYNEETSEVLAIVGITRIWDGVYEAWTFLSKGIKTFPKTFHKSCLAILSSHRDGLDIKRYQAIVKVGFVEGQKWIYSLGFEIEGVMRNYGPEGADYYMCGRIT